MGIRSLRTHPLVLRRLQVAGRQEITPRLVRITFTGEQLEEFEAAGRLQPAFSSPAFDDHVKIVFGGEGPVQDAVPVQLPHGIEWTRSEHRVTRDYTPRRVEQGVLEMDFVLGHDGPASDFAVQARPGDETWIVGPKSSTVLPEALDWIVLVGDETALPAIARFLEERPTEAPATVYVLHTSPLARIDLPTRPQDRVRWVEATASDEEAPLRVVREHAWAEGEGYVWGAGESKAFLAVRRHLRGERGMPSDRVNVTGYWHQQSDEQEVEPSSEPDTQAVAGWFALRAAVRLGVLDLLAGRSGTVGVDVLAAAARVRADALTAVLEVLAGDGYLRVEASGVALSDRGRVFLDDEHARESVDGFDADVLLSLAHLDGALQTGRSSWEVAHGDSLLGSAASDTGVAEELAEHAESVGFVVDALLDQPFWREDDLVGLVGPGALVVAHTARDRGATAPFTVAEDPTMLGVLRASGEVERTTLAVDLGSCAAVVAALALGHRTDAETAELLTRAAAVTRRLVVVEAFRADALGGESVVRGLLGVATTGAPPRDVERVEALAASAGWAVECTIALGWGYEALLLHRP